MDEGTPIQPSATPAPMPSPPPVRTAGSCQTCGSNLAAAGTTSGQPQYVLAIGKIRLTYPSESVEKHFAQVIGRHDSKGRSDLQVLREVLHKPENRYLARLACWTLDIMDFPAYVLHPRGEDYTLLIDALRPASGSTIDVVIGEIKGLATPRECNNLQLPRVVFDTAYVFEKEQLVKEMTKPEKMPAKDFEGIAQEVFDRAMRPNKGIGLDIPKNFVFVFYDKVYGLAAQKASEGYSLVSIDAQPSQVSGPHQLASVCMKFRHRQTDLTERYCCTVNCDGEFPYLAEPLHATNES